MNGKRRTPMGKRGAVKARITDECQLPDFIFQREIIFKGSGLAWAGYIVTDVPDSVELTDEDNRLIEEFTAELKETIGSGADVAQASSWRDGKSRKTSPIPMDLLKARASRCIVVEVQVPRQDVGL